MNLTYILKHQLLAYILGKSSLLAKSTRKKRRWQVTAKRMGTTKSLL